MKIGTVPVLIFTRNNKRMKKITGRINSNRGIFWVFFYVGTVLSSTLLHLPPLRFHCVGGYWDGTQYCCDFGMGSQTF
jgi:hypothetical protein